MAPRSIDFVDRHNNLMSIIYFRTSYKIDPVIVILSLCLVLAIQLFFIKCLNRRYPVKISKVGANFGHTTIYIKSFKK